MNTAANIAIGFVALLHAYFLVLEMFLWDTPFGRRVFKSTPEFAAASKALFRDQGLYTASSRPAWSGGWHWAPRACRSRFSSSPASSSPACSAPTASRAILFVQAIPGILALALLLG